MAADKTDDKKPDAKPDAKMSRTDMLAQMRPSNYVPPSSGRSETIHGGATWRNGFLVDGNGAELSDEQVAALSNLISPK